MTLRHVYCRLLIACFSHSSGHNRFCPVNSPGWAYGWINACPRVHYEENDEGLDHANLLDTEYQAFAGLCSASQKMTIVDILRRIRLRSKFFISTRQLFHKPRPSLLIQLFFPSCACKLTNALILPTKYCNVLR